MHAVYTLDQLKSLLNAIFSGQERHSGEKCAESSAILSAVDGRILAQGAHSPAVRCQQTTGKAQQRSLSPSRCTDHSHDLPLGDMQGDILTNILAYPFKMNHTQSPYISGNTAFTRCLLTHNAPCERNLQGFGINDAHTGINTQAQKCPSSS